MEYFLKKERCRELVLALGVFCFALALVAWSKETMAAMRDGLSLCGTVILPSLFPFFVLSSLVVELGMSRWLGKLFQPMMSPLFRVNGACASAVALGFIGGYPVGARTAISLYENGQCSKTEAERLLAFCNNSGPAFLLGVVGTGVFGSGSAGVLLSLVHIGSSLLVGLLFRFYRPEEGARPGPAACPRFQAVSFPAAFTSSVTGAFASALNICAFILFFTVVIRMLTRSGLLTGAAWLLSLLFGPLGLSEVWARRLLTGLLEVSSGVTSLTDGSYAGRLSMAAFLLGWAGLSVHCQVLTLLGNSGLSMKTCLIGKLLHGGFSALLMSLLTRLVPLPAPASASLGEPADILSALSFQQALTISAASAGCVWLLFFALTAWAAKKSSGKSPRLRV